MPAPSRAHIHRWAVATSLPLVALQHVADVPSDSPNELQPSNRSDGPKTARWEGVIMSTVPTTGSSPDTHVFLAVLAVGLTLALAIAAFIAVDDGSAGSTAVPSATTTQADPGSADALERRAEAFASDRSSFGGPDAAERWLIDRAGV